MMVLIFQEIDTNPNDGNNSFDSDVSIFSPKQPKNKYAMGIPLELGAHIHIGNKIKFRVGSAIHFTSTDYIDGINNSINFPIGSGKDNLLFTHIAIAYDFNSKNLDLIFCGFPAAEPSISASSKELISNSLLFKYFLKYGLFEKIFIFFFSIG